VKDDATDLFCIRNTWKKIGIPSDIFQIYNGGLTIIQHQGVVARGQHMTLRNLSSKRIDILFFRLERGLYCAGEVLFCLNFPTTLIYLIITEIDNFFRHPNRFSSILIDSQFHIKSFRENCSRKTESSLVK